MKVKIEGYYCVVKLSIGGQVYVLLHRCIRKNIILHFVIILLVKSLQLR